jgi:WhiB family redox-sensing transcriptional regulator
MTRQATDWQQRGACLDESPDLFFPIGTTGPAAVQLNQAKRVCARCAVTDDCLQWAMSNNVEQGVWGGLSEEERRSLRRRAARHRLPSS